MGSDSNVNQKRTHSHNDLDVMPKYLTTTHYYIDRITYPNGKAVVTKAESPSLSVKEGQESYALAKLLKAARTASTFSIRTETTQAWEFARIGTDHGHGSDEHVYESSYSIESFEESVKNECSKLGKNKGCVFGHVEIDPELVKTKCLIAEMAKLNVSHNLKKDEDKCVNVSNQISLTVNGIKIVCDDRK